MTIYDDIGGHDAVAAVVDAFYERVLADPHLAPWFDGIDTRRLKSHQRSFVAAAIGGPATYAGRPMTEAHAGLDVTAEAFARVVDHLTATLALFAVPADTIATITATLAPLEPDIVTHHPTAADPTRRPESSGPEDPRTSLLGPVFGPRRLGLERSGPIDSG